MSGGGGFVGGALTPYNPPKALRQAGYREILPLMRVGGASSSVGGKIGCEARRGAGFWVPRGTPHHRAIFNENYGGGGEDSTPPPQKR